MKRLNLELQTQSKSLLKAEVIKVARGQRNGSVMRLLALHDKLLRLEFQPEARQQEDYYLLVISNCALSGLIDKTETYQLILVSQRAE